MLKSYSHTARIAPGRLVALNGNSHLQWLCGDITEEANPAEELRGNMRAAFRRKGPEKRTLRGPRCQSYRVTRASPGELDFRLLEVRRLDISEMRRGLNITESSGHTPSFSWSADMIGQTRGVMSRDREHGP